LPRLSSGKWIGSWALAEAEAGSDISSLKTVARQVAGGWVLKGKKQFIINGKVSKLVVVIAKTKMPNKKEGISAFVVDKCNGGVIIGNKDDKMGMRASEIGELIFKDCYVPSENVLGQTRTGISASDACARGRQNSHGRFRSRNC